MKEEFHLIKLTPQIRQLLVDELRSIILIILCFVVSTLRIPYLSTGCFIVADFLIEYLIYRFACLVVIRYTITDNQLIVKHGLFHRVTDYMELYRITDYQQRMTFVQQILGLKSVVIFSNDRTMPVLVIKGLNAKEQIIEEMRKRVEINKRRRGVYEFSNSF